MKIIDIPKKHTLEDYNNAINKQVDVLSKVEGVTSIYQIGGLSTPGISDIDLVVVFKDDFRYDLNPRINNDDIANYLFTHGLYGASEQHFQNSLRFSFFHNFRLLYGENLELTNPISEQDQSLLKEQIALEFLFKMYINIAVQKSYNTIKLRSMFLHIKALPYDFEFLNINPFEILSVVSQGIRLRSEWLDSNVSKYDIIKWFKMFFKTYELFLVDLFKDHNLYASFLNFKIAPNINISNSEGLSFERKGFVFPDVFNILDKKYFKALNKFNDFNFNVPLSIDAPNIVKAYFSYADKVGAYNQQHLPHFMTLTSSLKVYK